MSEEQEQPLEGFAPRILPWLVAAAALTLYTITLNHWVTLSSLPVLSRVAGWDWSPPLQSPLLYVITLPFRLFSPGFQPLALNFLSALMGAFTLGLLARSVALLPHDRTREQRQRERSDYSLLSIPAAWLPPAAAALVAGLQLTFWEHATAATGEMLNLLVFAYAIRCLLEYRIEPSESWLYRMAIVYGLGLTNNWALIAFFPAVLVATIWICGKDFFRSAFLLRLMLCGLAGLSLYLLLPLLAVMADPQSASFLEYLRTELGAQKSALLGYPKGRVLILSLTSLLPILVMGIRWPSSFGDVSVLGSVLTNVMFRIVHGLFLVACLWVAFDPKFSPRALGYGLPFLTFYYLGALSIGYFAGYFLLVFGKSPPSSKSWHRTPVWQQGLNGVVSLAVWAASLGVPAALAYLNGPSIRAANAPTLKSFADLLSRSVSSSSVALSDDVYFTHLVRASRASQGAQSDLMLIESRSLNYPAYHRHLQRLRPGRWPALLPADWRSEPVDAAINAACVNLLAQSNQVFYLHPSFGYLFEEIYSAPVGLVLEMRAYPTNAITPPPTEPARIASNRQFWKSMEPDLGAMASSPHIKQGDLRVLGSWYSRCLNSWGVELQRAGEFEEAGRAFSLAHRLNPDNLPAAVNARYNQSLRSGQTTTVTLSKSEEDLLGQYRSWDDVLVLNGPFDEPEFCGRMGQQLAGANNLRQAAIQFIRVAQLQPQNLQARMWLANTYLRGQAYDKVLALTQEMRSQMPQQLETPANQVELIRIESLAKLGSGELETAERALLAAQQKYPRDLTVLDTLFYLYFSTAQFSNVLAVIEKQLALNPQNIRALLNKGATLIQIKAFKEATVPLDQALKIQPDNEAALRNRAIAHLQGGQLDFAEADYKALARLAPGSHVVSYGMGEIAYQRKDTARAIRHYQEFLRRAPQGTVEIEVVTQRLRSLAGDPVR